MDCLKSGRREERDRSSGASGLLSAMIGADEMWSEAKKKNQWTLHLKKQRWEEENPTRFKKKKNLRRNWTEHCNEQTHTHKTTQIEYGTNPKNAVQIQELQNPHYIEFEQRFILPQEFQLWKLRSQENLQGIEEHNVKKKKKDQKSKHQLPINPSLFFFLVNC